MEIKMSGREKGLLIKLLKLEISFEKYVTTMD
jgi:hypothetical protein